MSQESTLRTTSDMERPKLNRSSRSSCDSTVRQADTSVKRPETSSFVDVFE